MRNFEWLKFPSQAPNDLQRMGAELPDPRNSPSVGT